MSTLLGLQIVGVDPVYAISSAGFVGLALALSGQDIIKNLLAGTMAILEDRYAVGDQVAITLGSNEVNGTIDLMGPASIRLRTEAGATWHAGHSAIDSVTNYSQLAASSEIAIPTTEWNDVEDDAARRLTTASNDVGLTGVDLPARSRHAGASGRRHDGDRAQQSSAQRRPEADWCASVWVATPLIGHAARPSTPAGVE